MNRSWVRFPQAAQIRPPGSGWAFLYVCAVSRCCLWLVAPRVFRAPEGPAAREARRPHFVRRRASKPARALRSLRRPPHQWRLVADVWLGASSQGPPWPCHRPSISHVIPLRLVQTLNLHRWNCNVFAWSRKVTAGNYVRLLVSVGSAAAFGCWGRTLRPWSSPVEWCNRFVSFGLGYALSWSGVSSCWVGCGVSRDLVRMSRLR